MFKVARRKINVFATRFVNRHFSSRRTIADEISTAHLLQRKVTLNCLKLTNRSQPIFVQQNSLIHLSARRAQQQEHSIKETPKIKEVLVYEGQLTPSVRRIKVFSLTTTFLGLVCYPFMFKKASSSEKSAIAHVFVGWTLIMVIFSPLALNYITKRYITELRFNRETRTFRAITLNLFNRKVETKFKQNNVHVPMVPGLFTSFLVNKKAMFMDPAYVKDIEAYQHLLGYDKPFDFSLNSSKKKQTSSK